MADKKRKFTSPTEILTIAELEAEGESIDRETAQTLSYEELDKRYRERIKRRNRRDGQRKRRLREQREQIQRLTAATRVSKKRVRELREKLKKQVRRRR